MCASLRLLTSVFLLTLTNAPQAEAEVHSSPSCLQWKADSGLLGSIGIKLGDNIEVLNFRYERRKSDFQRAYDGATVDLYKSVGVTGTPPGVLFETIRCTNGDRIVIGIRSGTVTVGNTPNIKNWRRLAIEELRSVTKSNVHITSDDISINLIYLKAAMDARCSGFPSHALYLIRGCRKQFKDDNYCSIASQNRPWSDPMSNPWLNPEVTLEVISLWYAYADRNQLADAELLLRSMDMEAS
ncbi:hypothetical protein [Oricola cellulosilytica]|uniref:Uncharacterized protein n=1 Tax=Oricola cellulosilytica TaxID=1429082 RepID=A0A4R0PB41_9HYPH|nr:hypothetical protein [Oricola cellulosilytica]TCD14460.1 hypothetical protein E0D97_10395 [Oricola cellulosilytica]